MPDLESVPDRQDGMMVTDESGTPWSPLDEAMGDAVGRPADTNLDIGAAIMDQADAAAAGEPNNIPAASDPGVQAQQQQGEPGADAPADAPGDSPEQQADSDEPEVYHITDFQFPDGTVGDLSLDDVTQAIQARDDAGRRVADLEARNAELVSMIQSLGAESSAYGQQGDLNEQMRQFLSTRQRAVPKPPLEWVNHEDAEIRQRYVRQHEAYERDQQERAEAQRMLEASEKQRQSREQQVTQAQHDASMRNLRQLWPESLEEGNGQSIDTFLSRHNLRAQDVINLRDPRMVSVLADAYRMQEQRNRAVAAIRSGNKAVPKIALQRRSKASKRGMAQQVKAAKATRTSDALTGVDAVRYASQKYGGRHLDQVSGLEIARAAGMLEGFESDNIQ